MRNGTASGNHTPHETHGYSPSVPISVYRQVTADLEAMKAQMEALNAQNLHLARENQQLRQEIDKVIQIAYRLQQIQNTLPPFNPNMPPPPPAPNPPVSAEPPHPSHSSPAGIPQSAGIGNETSNPFPFMDSSSSSSPLSERLFTEQQEIRPSRGSKPPRTSDMAGVWLVVFLVAIVLSAFGAGYFVVRPMFLKR
ncbi:hypothetical protein [Kamptonema formosum]|uniref:hypothetical protein n=1 Tax=Kamptonema formosum TaxID=331992 RepID=UPI000346DB4D|nr:hypothetical protein [Oscillatoria sp. PCC 10802]